MALAIDQFKLLLPVAYRTFLETHPSGLQFGPNEVYGFSKAYQTCVQGHRNPFGNCRLTSNLNPIDDDPSYIKLEELFGQGVLSEDVADAYLDSLLHGTVEIGYHGCTHYSFIVLNGPQTGVVWWYLIGSDEGFQSTGQTFDDWLASVQAW